MDLRMMREGGGHPTGELKALHHALLNTENVEQFLHKMAVLAARLVGGDCPAG